MQTQRVGKDCPKNGTADRPAPTPGSMKRTSPGSRWVSTKR